MQQILAIIGVVVLVLVLGAVKERRRHGMLLTWVSVHPGARLHWGFEPDRCPGVPVVTLAVELMGREPSRWGAGVETPNACFVELSATRNAGETSKWYSLIAVRQPNGGWNAKIENGLLTRAILDQATG